MKFKLFLALSITVIVIIGLGLVGILLTKESLPCGSLEGYLTQSGCILKLNEKIPAKTVDFVPDGTMLLVSSYDGNLRLWRVTDGELVRVLEEYKGAVSESLSPNGSVLAISSGPGVELWEFDNNHLLNKLSGDTGRVVKVTFSQTGETVAAAVYSHEDKVLVWNVTNETPLHIFKGHKSYINDVAISPDGSTVASGSSDRTVRLWRISNGELLHILYGHQYSVEDVAFSPDGTILASGSTDNTIRLWRVNDGELLQVFEGHTGHILSLAFSPDGTILASGSRDGTVRLWKVTDGTLLRTVRQRLLFGGWVWSLAFSPDGKMLATALSRGPVRVFDVGQMLNQ